MNCNKYTSVVGDVNNEGSYVGAKRIWEIIVSSLHFSCEYKTPLKNEVYLKTNRLTTPRAGEDVEELEVYLKTNRLTTPRAGEDVEELNSHTLLLGI